MARACVAPASISRLALSVRQLAVNTTLLTFHRSAAYSEYIDLGTHQVNKAGKGVEEQGRGRGPLQSGYIWGVRCGSREATFIEFASDALPAVRALPGSCGSTAPRRVPAFKQYQEQRSRDEKRHK